MQVIFLSSKPFGKTISAKNLLSLYGIISEDIPSTLVLLGASLKEGNRRVRENNSISNLEKVSNLLNHYLRFLKMKLFHWI